MPGTVDIKDTGKALPGDKGLEFADDFCLQQSEFNDILIKNNFWWGNNVINKVLFT